MLCPDLPEVSKCPAPSPSPLPTHSGIEPRVWTPRPPMHEQQKPLLPGPLCSSFLVFSPPNTPLLASHRRRSKWRRVKPAGHNNGSHVGVSQSEGLLCVPRGVTHLSSRQPREGSSHHYIHFIEAGQCGNVANLAHNETQTSLTCGSPGSSHCLLGFLETLLGPFHKSPQDLQALNESTWASYFKFA